MAIQDISSFAEKEEVAHASIIHNLKAIFKDARSADNKKYFIHFSPGTSPIRRDKHGKKHAFSMDDLPAILDGRNRLLD